MAIFQPLIYHPLVSPYSMISQDIPLVIYDSNCYCHAVFRALDGLVFSEHCPSSGVLYSNVNCFPGLPTLLAVPSRPHKTN